jgi:peptide/nickel transport system substrate-binding protein
MLGTLLAACGPTDEPAPTEPPVVEPTEAPAETTEAPPVGAEDLLDEIMAADTLVVSTDPNYAPWSFLNDDGELDGFDVNVAQEVAARMGVELVFETPDWDMITGGNWGGRWDVSIGSMTATEQRSEVLWFTDPYYYVPASFAVHKDNTTIASPADLGDANLGLGTATTYEDYLNGILSMLSGEIAYDPPAVGEITAYTTDQEAVQDLALGDGVRLDAVMTSLPTVVGAIEEGVPLKVIGTPAFYEGLVFALDKSRGPSDKLIAKFNEIIADMHNDGTLSELSLKWTGVDYTTIVQPGEEPPPAESNRGKGGTVTILYWQAVSTLNAYLSGGTKDIEAASLITEPLGRYDETGKMMPWLAAEIPTVANGGVSEDLTSITWKLKEGLLWSDGTPVTAEDVAFSWEYCVDPEMGCNALSWFAGVESVEAVDPLTVKITFDGPKPYPYGPFVGAESPIIQKAQFQDCMGARAQECTEQNFGPVGTGPYKVKEFRANDVVLYEINENYRDPNKPYFSEVIFKGGGDAAAAARAVLETGEADYAWNVQVEQEILAQMEAAGIGTVVPAYSTGVERIMINFTNPDPALGDMRSVWSADDPNPHPFLSDINVRRALSLAIDRSIIAEQLYGAAGKPTCNVLPAPDIYVSTANDECLVQDIAQANAILDEAGWLPGGDGIRQKDGVRLSILYQTSTNSVRQSTQALVKQWWSEIGVETELRNIDSGVFFGGDPASPDTYGKFYADVEMYTNDFSGTDPEAYMANWLCEEISGPDNQWLGNNIPRWCNADYEELVAQMRQTADLDERIALAKAMNDMLMQDYVMIPLVHRGQPSAVANRLQNVKVNPWDSELWNIADWTATE